MLLARIGLVALAIAGGHSAVFAQSPAGQSQGAGQPGVGGEPETSDKPSQGSAQPSIQSSLGAFGDPGGVRAALDRKGIAYSFTYIGEVLGNASGGLRRGSIYEGRLDGQLDADLDKLLGWSGAAFHTNFYQIHGTGLSRYFLGNLLVASGIEALPSTRLYELWVEQKLLEGRLAVRAGQLAADTEFLVSQYGALFVNSTFGWPAITASNLPSGGPAYPLATPGVRVKLAPTDAFSVLTAVFNGDPAGPGEGDPQRRNRTGTNFRLSDPPLLIAEAAYSYNQGKDAAGLPGTIKLGGWRHFGRFADQRFAADRLSLADPASSGIAARLRGNGGVYGLFDQLIYRVEGSQDQGIAAFGRVSASPGDRNLIGFYADGGLTFKGMVAARPDDTFGVSFGYARIASGARGLDRDAHAFGITGGLDSETGLYAGTPGLVRSSEALIEVTYQALIAPGWTVQPDFQYVFRPGGHIANARDPAGPALRDAAVFGLRTTIRY